VAAAKKGAEHLPLMLKDLRIPSQRDAPRQRRTFRFRDGLRRHVQRKHAAVEPDATLAVATPWGSPRLLQRHSVAVS